MNTSQNDNHSQAWVVCLSAALFFFYVFIQMNVFNALDPALIRTFHMPTSELGHLAAAYFYTNVLLLFPAGILLDRLSTKTVIMVSMAIAVIATLLFSMVTSVWQAEMCRALIGVGGAFCLLSNVRLATRWFPPKRMAYVIGIIVTMAMIGGMIAQTPFTLLTDHFGWRHAMLADGLLGCILFAVIAVFVKDFPPGKEKLFQEQHQQLLTIGFWKALFFAIRNWQNWLAGIYASLINLPIFIFAAWGSLYLVETQHLSRDQASLVISFIFVGMIVGSPFVGWISDYFKRRKTPMVVGAVACLAVVLVIMLIPHLSFIDMIILFFALGFASSSQILGYALVAESNPESITATAEALAATLIMAGGWLIPLFSALLNWHWKHVMQLQIPLYSRSEFEIALSLLPIGFLIALIASLSVTETFGGNKSEAIAAESGQAKILEGSA